MTKHQETKFWLSAKSVPLTLEQVSRLNDDLAREFLAQMWWGSAHKQVCPDCGAIDSHYFVRSQKRWRCKHCATNFSVISRTPFADCKIGPRRLLLAIFSFVINQKGLAALALRRIIGGSYKTSFTLLHKLRESLMLTADPEKLKGEIQVDGAHMSGRPRKKRRKADQVFPPDIPKKYKQQRTKFKSDAFPLHPNRRIVMVLRESFGEKGKGAARTVVAVCRSENTRDVEALIDQHVEKRSVVRTDEWSAYGNIKLRGYIHETVNHSEELSTDTGINQNQAESYFSRLKRANFGIYHRITPRYMIDYAVETAWREDVRRTNTLDQLTGLVRRVFRCGYSKDWRKYHQGNRRQLEILFEAPQMATP